MADKTVVLIDPNGEKISFTCPFKLMEFLDHVYYKQYIDHGALPYEWKWEWYQTYWKTIKYYEYKILVNCATNTYDLKIPLI